MGPSGAVPTATITDAATNVSPTVDGKVVAGGFAEIVYDASRLTASHPDCFRQIPEGKLAIIDMGFTLSGDRVSGLSLPVHSWPVTFQNDKGTRVANSRVRTTIPIPANTSHLAMWFNCNGTATNPGDNSKAEGDRYDNFRGVGGSNYVVNVDPATKTGDLRTPSANTAVNSRR